MKNLKISDVFDDIDNKMLDNVEVKSKFIFGISKSKIKRRVMNSISSKEYSYKSTEMKIKLRSKMIILASVIVSILVIPLGIFAANNSIAFRIFFEDSMNFLNGKTQDINLVANSNGITMNLETAVNDDKSGILLFNFTNNDGSKFDKEITLGEVTFEGLNGYLLNSHEKFSDDMKVLSCYTKVYTDDKLPNKKLTMTVKSLIKKQSEEKIISLDLKKLFDSKPISLTISNNDVIVPGVQFESKDGTLTDMQDFGVPIIPEIKDSFKIKGIAFINNKLRILTSNNSNDFEDIINCLIDSKTGQKTFCELKTNSNEGDKDSRVYSLYTFNISKPEELKNLQLLVSYTTKSENNGNWSVDFNLKRSEPSVSKDVNIIINDNNNNVNISKITISMKGLTVEGFITDEKGEMIIDNLNAIPNIKLNDGSNIEASWQGTEFNQKTKHFILTYEPEKLVDVNNLISITIQRENILIK